MLSAIVGGIILLGVGILMVHAMMPFGRAREGELGLNNPHQAERDGSSPSSGPASS